VVTALFKAAFFHFKADGIPPNGILPNAPAIMAYSLAHVRRIRGRTAVESAVGDNVAPIPVQRWQLDYYWHRGLTCEQRPGCIPSWVDQNWAPLYAVCVCVCVCVCVFWAHLANCFVVKSNVAGEWGTLFYINVHFKCEFHRTFLYNIFDFFFNEESHLVQLALECLFIQFEETKKAHT
jgi:hypothetical protein